MNLDKPPIITPFIKLISGVELIIWDYVQRDGIINTNLYQQFTIMSEDYALYSPIKFERL